MRRRIGSSMLAALAMVLAVAAPPLLAAPGGEPVLVVAQNDELISRDRAARIARERTGGRVLRVDLKNGEQPWYRVRVLIDGERVRSVAIDARSGRMRR